MEEVLETGERTSHWMGVLVGREVQWQSISVASVSPWVCTLARQLKKKNVQGKRNNNKKKMFRGS